MSSFEFQLAVAVCLDLVMGDPRCFPHPVRIIGFFCNGCEGFFRSIFASEYMSGVATLVAVLGLSIGGIVLLLMGCNQLSTAFAQIVAIFLLYTTIAVRDLMDHSKEVYKQLQQDTSLDPARKAVARIVGRDTSVLDRVGIIRATVETVAENMVDGVTAPLFYAVLFTLLAPVTGVDPLFLAVIGGMGYKAVNTMDSMFGYKNEQYLFFGRAAALLDDLVNWLPARISGLLLVPATSLCGLNWQAAWRVFKKDRLAHASPNAAHSEAAVAGALGVELGGVSQYFGKEMAKPVIGSAEKEIEDLDILRCNRLMLVGSLLFLLLLLLFRWTILQWLA